MEKTAVRKPRFRIGLLILCSLAMPAPALSALLPDGPLVEGEANEFAVFIPGASPAAVSFDLPVFPASIQLEGFKKEASAQYSPEGELESGTRLVFTLRINRWGLTDLPELVIRSNGKEESFRFPRLRVERNPLFVELVLSVRFASGKTQPPAVRSGEALRFTLYVSGAAGLRDFSWKLSEHALFRETERFPFPDPPPAWAQNVPLASFEWVPLAEGSQSLPEITVRSLSYGGKEISLLSPAYTIEVSGRKEEKTPAETVPAYLVPAFTPLPAKPERESRAVGTDEALQIASLRLAERRSPPFSKTAQLRGEYEKEFALEEGVNEPSIPLFASLLILCLGFVLLAALGIVFGRLKAARAFFVFTLVFALLTAVQWRSITTEACVILSPALSSVPESSAAQTIPVRAGSRAAVLSRAAGWAYVNANGTAGWIREDSVVFLYDALTK